MRLIEESQVILDNEERIEFIKNLQRDWPEYLLTGPTR